MSEYTVRAGDTLGRIAARLLGSADQWRVIATLNGLADPDALHVGQVLQIPEPEPEPIPVPRAGPAVDEVPPLINPAFAGGLHNSRVSFSEEARDIVVQPGDGSERGDKYVLGRKHRKGLYRTGSWRAEDLLRSGDPLLADLRLSDSEIRVMLPVSENEGALDAVNTWDNSFLSFGIFQWTAGPADAPGELPALLARIRDVYPDYFENYWGQFGLDVEGVQGATGWFTLDGRRLVSAADKAALREPVWALRFARAGADRTIQAMEVLHAIARLDGFYFRPQARFDDLALADLISSEYGVALLLDNHVNRPAYVDKCVAAALQQSGLSAAQARDGNDADEARLLAAYIDIREDFGHSPMTDARRRAEVMARYRDDKDISAERGSFVSNREARSRNLDPAS